MLHILKQASLIKDGGAASHRKASDLSQTISPLRENKDTQRSSDAPHPLAFLLAFLAENNERNSLTSGNHMIIFTAAITSLMITCCFGAAGYWLEEPLQALWRISPLICCGHPSVNRYRPTQSRVVLPNIRISDCSRPSQVTEMVYFSLYLRRHMREFIYVVVSKA